MSANDSYAKYCPFIFFLFNLIMAYIRRIPNYHIKSFFHFREKIFDFKETYAFVLEQVIVTIP